MTSPIEHTPEKSPLESLLISNNPLVAALFARGSGVARAALGQVHPESTLTLAPLRGAMPVLWAAEGLPPLEGGLDNNVVEVPIGQFYYTHRDGTERMSSPKRDQKQTILREHLDRSMDVLGVGPENTHIIVLDEVQKGGTLGTLTQAVRTEITKRGLQTQLRVVAAQDSRPKVTAQPKTPEYRKLASGGIPDTEVTVVPLPLIATDRPGMLDRIDLVGSPSNRSGFTDRLIVTRNTAAEELFRTIGTLSRRPDVRHDPYYIDGFVDSQGIRTASGSNRVQEWMKGLVDSLDRMALEDR